MKKRFLAAMAVAATGLICAATGPASARPVALSTMIHPDTGSVGGPNVAVPQPAAPQPAVAATVSPSPTATYSEPPAPNPTGTPTFASNFSGKSLNDAPDFQGHLAASYRWEVPRGDLSLLVNWLSTNIHGAGARLGFNELLSEATGSKLNPQAFEDHLTVRYL